ncbi:histidine kinase [Actinomyces sp. oral taxon 897]|nr:histidine kinase [Actinomyces sp. oral taxon 897]
MPADRGPHAGGGGDLPRPAAWEPGAMSPAGRPRTWRTLLASLLGAVRQPRRPEPRVPEPAPRQMVEREPAAALEVPALSLGRVRSMLSKSMGYHVRDHVDEEHPSLLGTWNGFPFVIEEPAEHPGWLLVSGDWQEPALPGQRDELAASVNDWNRDKFFPTVALVDTPVGPLVRTIYLVDLTTGVTDRQLRLHLNTALASCTQALAEVRPLLPEL